MLPTASVRSRPRTPRNRIAAHTKSPRVSSACQNRARSMYSHPWPPNGFSTFFTMPWMPRNSPISDQGAEDHDRERAEQRVGQDVLPPGLPAGDDRGEEDAGGEERRGHPEDRQLHVPGPGQVVREQLGQVEAEEGGDVGPVVLAGRAHERLREEQHPDDEEEPGGRPLRRGE